jgi:hypothetical protein
VLERVADLRRAIRRELAVGIGVQIVFGQR